MDRGSGTVPLHSPGGSTLQWGTWRGLLCLALRVRVDCLLWQDWCERRRMLVLLLVVNISLASLFYNLLYQ